MKHRYPLILIILFCLSFSISDRQLQLTSIVKGKVLLISYHEDVGIKILKDYKRIHKRFRYISVNPCDEKIRFNSLNKTFDITDDFKVTDSTKIIFSGNCIIEDVTVPYRFSNFQLDEIKNDSIVVFSLNNKKYTLMPNQEMIDNVFTIKKEGRRIIEITTRINVKNYGLIEKKNIFDLEGQENRWIREKLIRDSLEYEEIKNNE